MPTTKKPRVSTLVPSDPELPPAAIVQRFITFYVNHRDLKLAAAQASLDPVMGERLYKNEKVRERIDRKIMLVDVEEAKLAAKSKRLNADLLDASLVEEVSNKKNGFVRVRAIELGYKRVGMIRDGEFYVAPDPNARNHGPSIYRAQQTSVKRTVTEEVTHTEVVAVAPTPDPIFAVQEY